MKIDKYVEKMDGKGTTFERKVITLPDKLKIATNDK